MKREEKLKMALGLALQELDRYEQHPHTSDQFVAIAAVAAGVEDDETMRWIGEDLHKEKPRHAAPEVIVSTCDTEYNVTKAIEVGDLVDYTPVQLAEEHEPFEGGKVMQVYKAGEFFNQDMLSIEDYPNLIPAYEATNWRKPK